MDIQRYQRAHELFDALVDAPEAAQREALRRAHEEDPELGALLERLLELDQGASPLDTVAGRAPAVLLDALQAVPAEICGMPVLRELGRGGMGVVYEAQQDTPRRRVALKTLPPLRDTPQLREHLRAEVEALARVEHPGVPAVYQLLEEDGVPVLSMELVRGRPLSEYAVGRPLRERMALLMSVAEAVAAAHGQGVVHRDLKPANVLVTPEGQVKLLDFGIASLEGERGLSAGTPQWCAPEQQEEGPTSPATDVFGLGALGWALLTGDPPPALPPSAALPRPPGTPRPLHAVLTRALSRDPARRHRDAQAFLDDLRAWSEDRVVSPLLGQPGPTLAAALRRRRGALVLLGGLALLLALTGLVRVGLERRAQALRGEAARVELRALRRLAERLGPEHPEVQRALDSFVDAPDHRGLPELHEAWLWWDEVAERTGVAAGMAWWTAPDEARRQAALQRLALRLAERQRWDGLEHLLPDLPPDALPEQRRALAEVRLDLPALERSTPPELAPLRALLREAQPLPLLPEDAAVLPDGGLALFTAEEVLLTDAGFAIRLRWPTGEGGAVHPVTAADGALWFVRGQDAEAEVMRWPAGAEGPESVERLPGARQLIFRDLDQDGQIERYTVAPMPALEVWVAEPEGGPSRPGPALNPNHESRWMRALLGPDAAGAAWVSHKGWGPSGVERVEGLPDAARVTGRVRMFANGLVQLRTPEGPRLLAYGHRAGVLPGLAGAQPETARLAYIEAEPEPHAARTETPPFIPGVVLPADLNGDGWDDLVIQHAGDLHLRLEGPEGPGPWLHLPGVSALAAGQLDEDPADELIIGDGVRGWALGVAEAPPLPRRVSDPLPAPRPPPPDLHEDAGWLGLEQLVRLQLGPEVARRFEALGASAGEDGRLALERALELYEAPDDLERVAHALALRDPAAGRAGPAHPHLLRAHDREGLWGTAEAQGQPRVRFDADHPPPWRVRTPESVHLRQDEGFTELSLHTLRGPALELPLDGGARSLELELELELLEVDWSVGFYVELVGEGWAARATLGRGSGSNWGLSRLTLRCGAEDDTRGQSQAFSLAADTLRVSWLAEAGSLRCGFGTLRDTSRPMPAPTAPLLLRIGADQVALEGAARVRLRSLTLIGARPRSVPLGDGLAMLLGDAAATARIAASPDLVAAMEARRALGLPPRPPTPGTAEALLVLLRVAPERWLQRAQALLGEDFPAQVYAAWYSPMRSHDPWALERLRDPSLHDLPLHSEAARSLAALQAQALMHAGLYLEAERLLAPLRARGMDEAWHLSAQLRVRQGLEAETLETLRRWQSATERPARALDVILQDPDLAPLLGQLQPLPAAVE
ncbi:MAG: serine/threonine protein kinase [Alphaproteobacteria bacterium]|nr:serine/threonine protein kinase [Alphaproteobacteria bacterium]